MFYYFQTLLEFQFLGKFMGLVSFIALKFVFWLSRGNNEDSEQAWNDNSGMIKNVLLPYIFCKFINQLQPHLS